MRRHRYDYDSHMERCARLGSAYDPYPLDPNPPPPPNPWYVRGLTMLATLTTIGLTLALFGFLIGASIP